MSAASFEPDDVTSVCFAEPSGGSSVNGSASVK